MTATRTKAEEPAADESRQPRLTAWLGVVIATALVALALWGGAHLSLPGLHPGWLAVIAGVLVVWAIVAVLAWCAAELLRRHHRAIAAASWRGGSAAARAAGSRIGRLLAWIGARLAGRWRRRGEAWRRPLFITRRPGGDGQAGDDPDPPPGSAGPGTNDPPSAPAAGGPERNGDPKMTTQTAPNGRGPRPEHDAPPGWKTLAGEVGDFEPADDGELLDWMSSQVAGMLAYGEAIADVHEHCVSAVRLDPAAMAALHDVADAVADAAEAMARAREQFRQVYEAPRTFVGDGGVLPKDGDFLTGDGD